MTWSRDRPESHMTGAHQEVPLHGSLWRDHPDPDDEVLDVPVDVLLHTGGSRGHPAPQAAELQGVRLVARCVPTLLQLQTQGAIQ